MTSLRRVLNRNAATTMSLAMAVITVSVLVVYQVVFQGAGGGLGDANAYFYDLNSGRLFIAPRWEVPPIDGPTGPGSDGQPAGVLAHIYSCGACGDGTAFIAYLETYTPIVQTLVRKIQSGDDPGEPWGADVDQGHLWRRADASEWRAGPGVMADLQLGAASACGELMTDICTPASLGGRLDISPAWPAAEIAAQPAASMPPAGAFGAADLSGDASAGADCF